jgi:cytoskeletal protein CcmA (bactofilin family)
VILDADSTADIAIIATQARITGHIQGTLNFKGQALIIGRTAVIDQDLDVAAQAVTVRGTVHGKLQGVYQQLIEGEDTP